jgi:hypothetical protein
MEMGGLRTLGLMLWLCTLSADRIDPTATGDVNAEAETPAVRMALTAFKVDDERLELSYKIVNGSDHDVWVCEGLGVTRGGGAYSPVDHEVYMASDARTLVIRKRLEVPMLFLGELLRHGGVYTRLSPGQERAYSLSFAIPVKPRRILASLGPDVTHARRLVMEVGFYDEDLREKIRRILEIAEKLRCTALSFQEIGIENYDLYECYFGGLEVSREFGGLSGFDDAWPEGSEEITIPRLWPGVLLGESFLAIVVDGVFIPYTR